MAVYTVDMVSVNISDDNVDYVTQFFQLKFNGN